MSEEPTKPEGPDFCEGVALSTIPDTDMLLGHVKGEPVLVVRRGARLFAVGTTCTHYGGPLADGLLVDDTVRCPWHHACFSLSTGQALRAPALDAISCWAVEQQNGTLYIREKLEHKKQAGLTDSVSPQSVLILGGGAAGNAAAETLRNEGYGGMITMLSADAAIPCDRPNLSKGYLAGTAPEAFVPLRSLKFYQEHDIDLRLNARVVSIDTENKSVRLENGSECSYDVLLLATGAEPVHLSIPGATLPHVHYLRTVADCNALIARAKGARRAVVMGASFIGLEVAASLRGRNIEVDVVAPGSIPMERILGPQVGKFVRSLHEQHGVTFHLGTTAVAIDEKSVMLKNGENLSADLVVIGIGVRPAVTLAEQAGLAMDRGVLVNEYLETSQPGIFAAGDIARWPDQRSDTPIRVEHWVVAERQGQTAARNILGAKERFDDVPFFWTEQYDFSLAYVGHAGQWDKIEVDGQLEARDCALTYLQEGKKMAVAVIGRDLEGLKMEREFEQALAFGCLKRQ